MRKIHPPMLYVQMVVVAMIMTIIIIIIIMLIVVVVVVVILVVVAMAITIGDRDPAATTARIFVFPRSLALYEYE